MGGDLFKLGRLPRDDYLALEADLRVYLDQRCGDLYRIPRYYGDKPDFGDLDIVLSDAALETTWHDFQQQTMADLGITRSISTAGVFSTVWRDFQVDYFVRGERYFESTYNFLCYNDLGNLLGRIFRRMNLKYGEQGLEYVFRRADQGSYKRVLPVGLNMERILALIDLDFATWDHGFATLEDMFEWVTGSPWFSSAPYLAPSSAVRGRSKTRPTMQKFLSWLHDNPVADASTSLADRDEALPMIDAAFPEARLLEAIAAERALEDRAGLVRSKFSGKKVMAMFPELTGKALGEFIRTFKDGFEDFEAQIAALPAESVDEAIDAHWTAFSTRADQGES